jgi:ribulose-phosphate 3-epimerase
MNTPAEHDGHTGIQSMTSEGVLNDIASGDKARQVMIAPSLISADWARAGAVIAELAEAGCEWLHFDAMDGHFVPNLTMGPMFLRALRPHSPLHFDAHLMLDNAGEYIDDFLKAGANSITVHVEGNPHLHRLVWRIKDGGALAGVVLNPATPTSALDAILPDLDMVLVMSVNPGFGGQKYLPLAVTKIKQLDQMRAERGLNFLIEIDGGMSAETIPAVVAAGVDVLVCGTSVFLEGQPLATNVRALREAVREGLDGVMRI